MATYQAAFPNHKIIQVDSSNIIKRSGALHCIAQHVYDCTKSAPKTKPPTPSSPPTSSPTLRVGDLSATKSIRGGKWGVTVTITVKSGSGALISGATVAGTWTGAKTGAATCTTSTSGTCQVVASNMSGTSVTFTTTSLAKTGHTYDPTANVKTAITITKA
jgi:hypothetical protein